MNIQATLDKCRKEYERQMAMEAHGSQELPLTGVQGDIELWSHEDKCVEDATEHDCDLFVELRNLNPTRLRVVEQQISNVEMAPLGASVYIEIATALLGEERRTNE